jgi:hypothetical protein
MPAHHRLLLRTVFLVLSPSVATGQGFAGHRLQTGPGTVLIVPDQTTGLTLWATRATRPGRRPSPDFVGWFDPDSVLPWVGRTRLLLAQSPPAAGDGLEAAPLIALDQGRVTLVLVGDSTDRPFLLSFGHPSERQRWVIEATADEIGRLLDTLAALATGSRLVPPQGLGYANPTHRAATPDREPGSEPPDVTGSGPGEVWAAAELDSSGAVIARTSRVLWAEPASLAGRVLAVLPGYRYHRRDGGRPARLLIYQRFRVRRSSEK